MVRCSPPWDISWSENVSSISTGTAPVPHFTSLDYRHGAVRWSTLRCRLWLVPPTEQAVGTVGWVTVNVSLSSASFFKTVTSDSSNPSSRVSS
eukprot:m.171759 g.171759  ORF g.171759 m.171759 type:complete len:93 (+) comp24254_c0_seq1:3925-4203(+)